MKKETKTDLVDMKTGQIKQHELMRSFYESAPALDMEIVKESMVEFFKLNQDEDYIILNSKLINYIQVFKMDNSKSAEEKADYILGFMAESFLSPSQDDDGTMVYEEDEVPILISMLDIRDVEMQEENLGLYIGATYFMLFPAGSQVEAMEEYYG